MGQNYDSAPSFCHILLFSFFFVDFVDLSFSTVIYLFLYLLQSNLETLTGSGIWPASETPTTAVRHGLCGDPIASDQPHLVSGPTTATWTAGELPSPPEAVKNCFFLSFFSFSEMHFFEIGFEIDF